jgi:hypothetical protein
MAPMDNRLLRPRASGLFLPSDADARAYVLAVNAADGQPLEKPVAEAIDAFVIGCKADSIWSAIQSSCILMGARTLSGALTPLVGSAPTNVSNNFVSGDYNRKTGLIGNESSKYLDTNRPSDTDGQDDVHQAVYVSELSANSADTTVRAMIGASGTGETAIFARRSDNLTTFRSRNSLTNTVFNSLAIGLIGSRRNSGANFQVLAPSFSATQNFNRPSESPLNLNVFVFASSNNGSPVFYTGQRLAFYSIGSSLDLLLLRGRVNRLYEETQFAINTGVSGSGYDIDTLRYINAGYAAGGSLA